MSLGSNRVLLIKSDPAEAVAMQEIMDGMGYRVDIYRDAAAGAIAGAFRSYPLVLCDMDMDGMDGFQVSRYITTVREEARVVLTTPHPSTGWTRECGKDGVYDVVSTPMALRRLPTYMAGSSDSQIEDPDSLERVRVSHV